ncbi:MAG: hypothetical protein QM784_21230 [Polyangiaceae bacterium]
MVKGLGRSPTELSVIYLGGGVATFLSSHLVGATVDRYGATRTLATLVVLTLGTHLAITQVTEASLALTIALFVAFMTTTSGRMIPTIALVTRFVKEPSRSRFLAVNTAVTDLSAGTAAWVAAGWFEGAVGRRGASSAMSGLGLCSALTSLGVLLWLWRYSRQNVQRAKETV